MKSVFAVILIFASFFSLQSGAAILRFYSNPRVPQPIFHVTLEYKGFVYEADPREGGRRLPAGTVVKGEEHADTEIEISDDLVNEPALMGQVGLPFDFKFVWDSNKTYCSKLIGKALDMQPTPMDFSGTHYAEYYPDWLQRHDPGLSPDQIYAFGMQHAIRISRRALSN